MKEAIKPRKIGIHKESAVLKSEAEVINEYLKKDYEERDRVATEIAELLEKSKLPYREMVTILEMLKTDIIMNTPLVPLHHKPLVNLRNDENYQKIRKLRKDVSEGKISLKEFEKLAEEFKK